MAPFIPIDTALASACQRAITHALLERACIDREAVCYRRGVPPSKQIIFKRLHVQAARRRDKLSPEGAYDYARNIDWAD